MDGIYKTIALVNATQNTEGKYILSNETVTKFEWKGLDDGDYMLTEVITPAQDITQLHRLQFTVNCRSHHYLGGQKIVMTILTSLTGNAATGAYYIYSKIDDNDVQTGLATNVVNK